MMDLERAKERIWTESFAKVVGTGEGGGAGSTL